VYLTSDSEHTLQRLEDDKIYVIGGIVDRNRLKRAAISKAESAGIATAKLPITDYLQLVTTKVLTCNHVFEILLKYRENGNDWKKAMLDVLPNRKDVKAKDDGVEKGRGNSETHAPDSEVFKDETINPKTQMHPT
jgi:tRNA (guanine9-N1)-methyltransferase